MYIACDLVGVTTGQVRQIIIVMSALYACIRVRVSVPDYYLRSLLQRDDADAASVMSVLLHLRRGENTFLTMNNRAEKDAVRWCHLTHQVFAGRFSS